MSGFFLFWAEIWKCFFWANGPFWLLPGLKREILIKRYLEGFYWPYKEGNNYVIQLQVGRRCLYTLFGFQNQSQVRPAAVATSDFWQRCTKFGLDPDYLSYVARIDWVTHAGCHQLRWIWDIFFPKKNYIFLKSSSPCMQLCWATVRGNNFIT